MAGLARKMAHNQTIYLRKYGKEDQWQALLLQKSTHRHKLSKREKRREKRKERREKREER
tara:strand:- start:289 stop:468 length:180 start_codon:yes stop_codon:yes gene_type:complete